MRLESSKNRRRDVSRQLRRSQKRKKLSSPPKEPSWKLQGNVKDGSRCNLRVLATRNPLTKKTKGKLPRKPHLQQVKSSPQMSRPSKDRQCQIRSMPYPYQAHLFRRRLLSYPHPLTATKPKIRSSKSSISLLSQVQEPHHNRLHQSSHQVQTKSRRTLSTN